MRAKEYLERIKQIDAIIADENEEYETLFEIASGFGGGFSIGERVQSSKNLQKMPDAVGAYMEVEKRIKALKRERQEIIDTIRTLPTNEYKILYKLYCLSQLIFPYAFTHSTYIINNIFPIFDNIFFRDNFLYN